MSGFYRRYLLVIYRFLPFAIAFLRDQRRFLLFGPGRQVQAETHRKRAGRMRDTMLELGPAFIKVGQVLSTRPDIVSPTYAEVFATLQDEVPEDAGGEPREVLRAELGDELDTAAFDPIAGGSLAFVYAGSHEGNEIALKVRRPGVKAQIERDLRVIRYLIPVVSLFVDERKQYSIENVADDFEEVILDELDFAREREMMREIKENLADDDRVRIPDVYEAMSSERVLAMEYLTGRKLTDDEAFSHVDVGPHEMATWITEIYLEMGLVHGVFHADPHPGNLAVTEAGRLLIYDFGMSERIPTTTREDIVGLYHALIRRDVDALADALIALDVLDPDVNRVEVGQVLELVIENLEGRSEITWRMIILELTTMLRDFPFRIPPDVMLLLRVGTVGEGVCRQLDPDFNFLSTARSFLVDEGLIEGELEAIVEETRTDLRGSLPALARIPARFDRTLQQLERGELVVRTESGPARERATRSLGYAVLAGASILAATLFTFQDNLYEVPAFVFALICLLLFVYGRRRR